MVHSDDTGLVLPPKVATTQVVIIPIVKKGDDIAAIMAKGNELFKVLKDAGIRVELDDRENYNPGWKFNNWELKGVPIRLELGAKDFAANEVRCAKRNDGVKQQMKQEGLVEQVNKMLDQIH